MDAEFHEMRQRVVAALEGRTNAFTDELRLHGQIVAALDAAGIPHECEVVVPGIGRVDFVLEGWLALEVKARDGGGRRPLRQLFGYLEDPRFRGGLLVSTKRVEMPMAHHFARDGRMVPVGKVELWRNAL